MNSETKQLRNDKNLYYVIQKKQIRKQVLVQPSVLNERFTSNLVPLRAERSESVPALFCCF